MDKSSFYDRLGSGLAELGCDDELCREWVEAAKEYLYPVSDSDFNKRGYVQKDVTHLIDRIVESPETAFEEVLGPSVAPAGPEAAPAPAEDVALGDVFAPDPAPGQDAPPPVISADTMVFDTGDLNRLQIGDEPIKRIDPDDDRQIRDLKQSRERPNVKGTPLFYALMIVTAPLWGPLYLAVWVLFGAAYAGVSLLIAAAALSMVIVVALGTALALDGIIYGVIQAIKVLPIGLFEIGLGISLAGGTLLFAIIFYNLAIRWLPRLYKYVTRFAKFVASRLSKLYYVAKKGSAKL